MKRTEIETLFEVWETEARKALRVIEALPAGQYDFRPQPEWRSIGELAWHLAEADAYMSTLVAAGHLDVGAKLPGLERPRDLAALAPGYRRVHEESVARLRHLTREDLDRTLPFFDGRPLSVRDILWEGTIHHLIHHRAQLSLLCRMAGGTPPGMYGPSREEMAAMMDQMKKARG
jgi:uncharacterized damage-inducible protein DinB